MAQKWYQKASVQVAMVTAVGFIIVALLTIAHQRSELNDKNKNLNKELETTRTALDDTKHERDKFQLQLAPFLAVANKEFKSAPEEKRLELLIGKLNEAVLNVEKAAKKLSVQRSIPPETSDRVVSDLKLISPLSVEIRSVLGDQESTGLAKQIKSLFDKAGWKVNWGMAVFNDRVDSFMIASSEDPGEEFRIAFKPIFTELGYDPVMNRDNSVEANTIWIQIGSK